MLLFFFDVRLTKLKLKAIKNDKMKNNLRDTTVAFFKMVSVLLIVKPWNAPKHFPGRSRDMLARETWDQLSPPVGLTKNNQF